VNNEPNGSYAARFVRVAENYVPVHRGGQVGTEAKIEILNATNFRKLLKRRRNKNDFKIYQEIDMNTRTGADHFEGKGQAKGPRIRRLLETYKDIVRTDLPNGLRPKRSIDHAIETEPEKKHHIVRSINYR
jgi:hypothetical protein